MPKKFTPHYRITAKIAKDLKRIDAAKEKALHMPLTPKVLASLRETARLYSTHYSTMIEGNKLNPTQVEEVLKNKRHFPGRERDEREVKGYYAALAIVEQWAAQKIKITEEHIQTLHALVMSNGRLTKKKTPYRDGQNVIRDGRTHQIVYLPPEAKDVPALMKSMVTWINRTDAPCPIIAGIAHYQFATIHPYYDGNGRTARLLATLILHLGGYGLKGIYSLEEYYALHLGAYYAAISIGTSHNYYAGRADADITPWIKYFIEGAAISSEKVLTYMHHAQEQGEPDYSAILRTLDPKQRKVLSLFQKFETVTSSQIGELLGFKLRTASLLCKNWLEEGFFEVVDTSRKGRKYKLTQKYEALLAK
jgi:Fic family protein